MPWPDTDPVYFRASVNTLSTTPDSRDHLPALRGPRYRTSYVFAKYASWFTEIVILE